MTSKDKNTVVICFTLCFVFSCIDYNAIKSINIANSDTVTLENSNILINKIEKRRV